jgi:hypothetical protein
MAFEQIAEVAICKSMVTELVPDIRGIGHKDADLVDAQGDIGESTHGGATRTKLWSYYKKSKT